ncbi:hypothetical protein CHS0354_003270, partial [Potamilus streckersoni]
MRKNRILRLLAGGLATAAGALMVTGTIVYGAKTADFQADAYHAGYTLSAFMSGLIAIVA